MPKNFLFTSESVSEGHPDKVADRISDTVLDAFLGSDPYARVACETLVTTNRVVIAGEVGMNAKKMGARAPMGASETLGASSRAATRARSASAAGSRPRRSRRCSRRYPRPTKETPFNCHRLGLSDCFPRAASSRLQPCL